MIAGNFSQRRAYVDLTVRGLNRQEGTAEFILDSGFNEFGQNARTGRSTVCESAAAR
jgi:hypothetical protein